MLRLAGFKPQMLADAIATSHRNLAANKTVFFAHEGHVTDERVVADHDVQLRAAEQLYKLSGAYASVDRGAGQGAVTVVILGVDGSPRQVARVGGKRLALTQGQSVLSHTPAKSKG